MERSVRALVSARVKRYLIFNCLFLSYRFPNPLPALKFKNWPVKKALALAAFLLLARHPLCAQPNVGVFQFLDGSTLHGSLAGIDPSRGIRWKHPAAASPIEFRPGSAHRIRFAQATPPPSLSAAQQICRFRFVNGDELTGQLLALDATHIELETWFAGRVRGPRASLQSLAFLARGFTTLYDGPDTLDGWTTGPTPTAWQLRDGVLTASANAFLGRDLKLPAQSRVEFEVGAANAMNLYVSLYTDDIARFNFISTGYQFNLGLGFVNLMANHANNTSMQHLGQAQIPVPLPGRKLRVEIRTDLVAHTLVLLVDGNVIQQWTDPGSQRVGPPPLRAASKLGQSGGLSFFAMNGGIQLSALKVTAWDGSVEPQITATNLTGHLVRLINQDRAFGQVEAIRDGRLALTAATGRLEIPLARITQVVLAPGAAATTNRPAGETHARLSSGETVALTRPSWDGAKLAGISPHFGPLQLEARWVRLLRFNPDREPATAELPLFSTEAQQFFER